MSGQEENVRWKKGMLEFNKRKKKSGASKTENVSRTKKKEK